MSTAEEQSNAGAGRDSTLARVRERIRGLSTYLGCGDDADDIAQETLVILVTKYPAAESLEELVRIANRICLNLVCNWRRLKSHQHSEELSASLPAKWGDPEALAANAELRRALLEVIEKSDRRCRTILRMELEGAETDEICRAVGLRPGGMYVARHRCWQRLRKAVGGLR